jgi:L-Ala-D/L-Glu epimerase
VKISRFSIMTVEIPMLFSIRHTLAERVKSQSVLVCATDEDGLRGWGESCPRSYVTGETVATVNETLVTRLMPAIAGETFSDFSQVVRFLEALSQERPRNELAAFCAFELAVLDLAGRRFGLSAGEVIGPLKRETIRYSGVIATNDPVQVAIFARRMRAFGLAEVKIKLGKDLENNLALLRAAREHLGEAVSLRADANAAWTGDEALRQLRAISAFSLDGIEQPVPAGDIEGMRAVTQAGITPVVADESLCSLEDAHRLIERRACDIFNLRLSKCGGLINAHRIHGSAIDAGLRCQLGAQVGETGILSAAGRLFATRSEGLAWVEGSYGRLLLESDITQPDIAIEPGGYARAIDGVGLGVTLIAGAVEKYRVKNPGTCQEGEICS